MNYSYILNIQGKILIILSLFKLTVYPWIVHFNEWDILAPMGISFVITLLTGILLMIHRKSISTSFHLKDAYFLVSVSWIVIAVFGSLPYLLTGAIPSVIDAIFESASGFSTTGASILQDIEALPASILYWRSLTHWIGGMGIIVLVVAVLPNLNIAGYHLMSAEMSGGITSDKIKPRIKDVAKRLWLIYIFLTFLTIIFLMFGNVSFYESLTHAFGAVSTGGFSVKNASVGYYSPYVQYVVMIAMLLSGINFVVHYSAITGKFRKALQNIELRAYIGIIVVTGGIISLILYNTQPTTIEQAFRDSMFQVISIITATGFITADYLKWDPSAWFLIFMLMFVGACVGSTGGGIKVIRHVIAVKYLVSCFLSLIHPKVIRQVTINGIIIHDDKVISVIGFIILYIAIVFIGGAFMMVLGVDLLTGLGSVLTCLGGIGPGFGEVGAVGNYSQIPGAGKIFLSFIMILGRLEILTMLVLFSPGFWKK